MSSREAITNLKSHLRREFLRTVGTGVPTLLLVAQETKARVLKG